MKKTLLLAMVLFVAAGWVSAQENRSAIYFGGGFGLPLSTELKDKWSSGETIEIGAGYLLQDNLELIGKFNYSHFKPDEAEFIKLAKIAFDASHEIPIELDLISFGGGADLEFYSISFGAKYFIPTDFAGGAFRPYVIGSAGMEIQKISDPEIVINLFYENLDLATEETGFLTNFGAGLDINFGSGFNVFVEGKYALHFNDPDNSQSFPLAAGFKLQFGEF